MRQMKEDMDSCSPSSDRAEDPPEEIPDDPGITESTNEPVQVPPHNCSATVAHSVPDKATERPLISFEPDTSSQLGSLDEVPIPEATDTPYKRPLDDDIGPEIKNALDDRIALHKKRVANENEPQSYNIDEQASEVVKEFIVSAFHNGQLKQQANAMMIAQRAILAHIRRVQEADARAAASQAVDKVAINCQAIYDLSGSHAFMSMGSELIDALATPTPEESYIDTLVNQTRLDQHPAEDLDMSSLDPDIQKVAAMLGIISPDSTAIDKNAARSIAYGGVFPGADGVVDPYDLAMQDSSTKNRIEAFAHILQEIMNEFVKKQSASNARKPPPSGTGQQQATAAMLNPDPKRVKATVKDSDSPVPLPLADDTTLPANLKEWLLQNVGRIQHRTGDAAGSSDGPMEDLCAPIMNNRFVIDWRGRDSGREVPMPLKEEVELEFPGPEHEPWREWIEHIRTIHPAGGGQRSGLDAEMRDDLMYGQCDVPELRVGSGAFQRDPETGLILYKKPSQTTTKVWTPMRYPKADVLLRDGRVQGANDSKLYRRVNDFGGNSVLSYPSGALVYEPSASLSGEVAEQLQVGNFDGSNGLPTLVHANTRRSREYRDAYAVIVPIRLNKYHWEYQYARGLANPLVEPASRTPVVPAWAYKTTDPTLVGLVTPATYQATAHTSQPCTTNVALPMMPTRSMGDKRIRGNICNRKTEDNKKPPREATNSTTENEEANFLKVLPTESRPHDYIVSYHDDRVTFVLKNTTEKIKDEKFLVDLLGDRKGSTQIDLAKVEEAKKARRMMWFPHHLQNTVEYPLRSGSQQAVEFDTDPAIRSTPTEEQKAPVFMGYPKHESDKTKSTFVGPTYPTVHLWYNAKNKMRLSSNKKNPRSGIVAKNKQKPPSDMLPVKEKPNEYTGINISKNETDPTTPEPQWIAPVNLQDVVENFLENNYDAFQYQHVREDMQPHTLPLRPKFDLPARKRSTGERTFPSQFNSEHQLINRPLKGKLGKGGLKVSLRLDTGGGQGMGGLDSYLPVPGEWDLKTVSEKGTRGFHEIWANPLGLRAGRSGPPHWYKQELKSMKTWPRCPWMEDVRKGEGVLPQGHDLYAHLPVEFIPPERIGLDTTLKRVLTQMLRDQKLPFIPEMGENLYVKAAEELDAKLQQPSAIKEKKIELEQASNYSTHQLKKDMRAQQEGATKDSMEKFHTTDGMLLSPTSTPMDVDDHPSDKMEVEKQLMESQNEKNTPTNNGDRNENVLVFPLYVTFYDHDDFERARYNIDCEWDEFMSLHQAYYRWADRFRLELRPGTTDVYRLVEGEREYEDPETGKLLVAPYEAPQSSTVVRVEGAEESGDGNPYGLPGGFCIRPRERYEESWRRDRREFGRPREPLRKIYPASGSQPIEVGDRPEDLNPLDKFKSKVENWTKAWKLREQKLYAATRNHRSEKRFEQVAKLARTTSARLSWYENIVKDDFMFTNGDTERSLEIQPLYFAFWAAKNVVALIDATTQVREQAAEIKMAHQLNTQSELQTLQANHPLLAAIAGQSQLEWTVWTAPDTLQIAKKLKKMSRFVHKLLELIFKDSEAKKNLQSDPRLSRLSRLTDTNEEEDGEISNVTGSIEIEEILSNIKEIDCLGRDAEATCAILEATIDNLLVKQHEKNSDQYPIGDEGKLRNSAQKAMAIKVADLKYNLSDNLEANDVDQLKQLYEEAPTTFDVMHRHTLVAESILSDPPLVHLVDTTILAAWPSMIPRNMEDRKQQGQIFMKVVDLINPHTDEIEFFYKLLNDPASFRKLIRSKKIQAQNTRIVAKYSLGSLDILLNRPDDYQAKALEKFQELKKAFLTDDDVKQKCGGRTLKEEFWERIQNEKYSPTIWNGTNHSGKHHRERGVKGVTDDTGYVPISEQEILQEMGNFYDGIGMIDVMVFDGNEHYGPKGAYRRYVLQIVNEWKDQTGHENVSLPMTYRAWYDSPLNDPEKYAGADPATGVQGWPKREHPGRERNISTRRSIKQDPFTRLSGPKNDMGVSMYVRRFLWEDDDVIPLHPKVTKSDATLNIDSPLWNLFPKDDDLANLMIAYKEFRNLEKSELAYHCTSKAFEANNRFDLNFTPFRLPYLFLFMYEPNLGTSPGPAYVEVDDNELPLPSQKPDFELEDVPSPGDIDEDFLYSDQDDYEDDN